MHMHMHMHMRMHMPGDAIDWVLDKVRMGTFYPPSPQPAAV